MAKFKLRGAFARADSNPINPKLVVLATDAADQAALLAVMVQACTALERIVTHDQHSLERPETRAALGSLMRVLNGEMGRQMDALVHGTRALRDLVLEEAAEW